MCSTAFRSMKLMLIVVLLAGACSKFEFRSGEGGACTKNSDCLVGLVCSPIGVCVATDAGQEIAADVAELPPETTEPIPEATIQEGREIPDVPSIEAQAETIEVKEVLQDIAEEVVAPEVQVEVVQEVDVLVLSPVGGPCEEDSDCESGSCIDMVQGKTSGKSLRVCVGPCIDDSFCPPGMECVPISKSANGYSYECRPFPDGLCWPCTMSEDCPASGSQCLGVGNAFFCSTPCPVDAMGNPGKCPHGFECKRIPGQPDEVAYQCVPIIGTCACNETTQSQTFTCAVSMGSDICWGEMACIPGKGWGRCPAYLPEPGKCHEPRPNCLEPSLAEFSFIDFDGVSKPLGTTCGTGVCAGGKVVCDGGVATCSSLKNKTQKDICFDAKDNDCDGKTDEEEDGCPPFPPDVDGDGDPNETDCDPNDPAKSHKLPAKFVQPCCPLDVQENQALKLCDYDCDGVVIYCDPNDHDHDGHVAVGALDKDGNPGDDCDDNDPHVFPGAPEKCGDGIDQDCVDGDLGCDQVLDKDGDGYGTKWDCADGDPSIHPWAPEVCNYKDDDCNGVVDDNDPSGQDKDGQVRESGANCGTDEGECSFGRWVCTHFPGGARMECLYAAGPTEELCDDLDNDCNGVTDDPWLYPGQEAIKGDKCDGSDLDKCKNGIWQCGPDKHSLVCNEIVWDVMEICGNKKDDDCDGVTDNGCFPADLDGDGYYADASDPSLRDCNDMDAASHPGAQEGCCDPKLSGDAALKKCDRNCDGKVTPCAGNDVDLDGFSKDQDCDDQDPLTYPGAPERCGDGKDQDCDGQDIPCTQVIDGDKDGYSPPFDCDDSDPARHPGAIELCNLQDDDCDGVDDDGNPEGGTPCGSSVGECRPGILVCVHYAYTARVECVPEKGPTLELCDGKDNNCDGQTDEYYKEIGTPCDGPDEDLCKNGVIVCAADGKGTTCGKELVENIKEVCDGVDNDCDGLVDEGFTYTDPVTKASLPLGATCHGYGECGVGKVECAVDQHRATCSTNADGSESQAIPEVCDGKDQDCDGVADNGMLYQGLPIGSICLGYGTCGVGIVECNKNKVATCSSNPDGSKPKAKVEKCNGLDDDCDGHTDEDVVPTAWDCKRAGVCAGQEIPAVCERGKWKCDYSVVPGYEEIELTCNGVDDNCNGQTDEGFPYQGKTVGEPCMGKGECGPGVVVCVSPTASTCSSNPDGPDPHDSPEVCNGKDDDCDDLTDEPFSYEGISIGGLCDGIGECGIGVVMCSLDGTVAICSTNPDGPESQAKPEVCNGLDDDCDGLTDEDFPVGQACDGPDEDQCAAGRYECNPSGMTVDCVGDQAGVGSEELCDGQDNDCDGFTDEDFPYQGIAVGQPCDGIGECGVGVVECIGPYKSTCSTNPDGTARQDGPEICDGRDNDCDGLTDEELAWQGIPLGSPCTAPGICGKGTVVCSPTDKVATCSTLPNGTEPKGGPELCNGQDDDCNGLVDDVVGQDLSGCKLQGVCDATNVKAICAEGKWHCDYSGVPGYQEVETVCDLRDNDCNGVTDDGYAYNGLPVGSPCDGIGACGPGTVVCSTITSAATCSTNPDGTEPENQKEACTQQGQEPADEDCDGETDEEGATYCVGYYLDQDGDKYGKPGAKKCLCYKGQVPGYTASVALDCDDLDPDVKPTANERCNDKDDNCNGKTDEAFPDKGQPCAGPPPNDKCMNGVWKCTADGTGLECVGYHMSPEVCNGLDDDCDGLTDEDFAWQGIPPGQPCDGTGECPVGVVVCISDFAATCSTNPDGPDPHNVPEKCNGKDDDCDGLTDEDWPEKNKPCDGPDPDFCKQGTWTCKPNGSGVECINEPVPPSPPTVEICDNVDNDCDGITDNPWDCSVVGPNAPCRGRKCDAVKNPYDITCKTGWWACNAAHDGLACVNETECAYGTICKPSGVDTLPDECYCGNQPNCTTEVATICTDGCKCGGLPACTNGNKCVNNACRCGNGGECLPPKTCVNGVCK